VTAPPILATRGLVKHFGGVAAVDGVDFALADGELRCLIGPNGAGKSTFFKMLTGQLAPTAGRIAFRGIDIAGRERHEVSRLGIGIKTQVPSVFDGLTVRENIRLAARRRHGSAEAARTVDETLALVALGAHADRLVGHLAHGQRQWVELGIVLTTAPRLLLLDEPTAGMTRDEVARTAALIQGIRGSCAMIVVEHDMQFVRMIAETVTVFHQGRILVEDSMAHVLRDQRVRDVYLGKQLVARHA
jgi:branched-chain amino acid transport system ATP-binding protein/urea transport system ATP-binding protein